MVQVDWRRHIGTLLAGVIVTCGGLALAIATAIPMAQNRGILLRDVQLVFEIYLLLSIILAALTERWTLAKIRLSCVIAVPVLFAERLATNLIPVNIGTYGVRRLSEIEFFLPDGQWNFLLTVLCSSLLCIGVYTFIVRVFPGSSIVSQNESSRGVGVGNG
jgi:hypothetical protein